MSEEEFSIDDLEPAPLGGLTDEIANSLAGMKPTIASVKVIERDSMWDKEGKELPDGETIKVKKILVETAEVGKDANGQPIIASEEFNTKGVNPATGKIQWSTHEKSKAQQFLNYFKVNHFKDVIGREAMVVKRTKGDWIRLGIQY